MSRFNQAYYKRYYTDGKTQVVSANEIGTLAGFVCGYLKYLGIDVESALDLGCGIGLWKKPLAKHFRGVDYRGVEVSDFLAKKYGWQNASIVDYDGPPADLVVCQGVLQYLTASEAQRAMRTLAAVTQEALYLEVLTQEDWDNNCDQSVTDGDVHLRPAQWYRKRLAKHFTSVGGGVFLPKESPVVLYELERP